MEWHTDSVDLQRKYVLPFASDEAYRDSGGYEQTTSFVDPSEVLLKRKIEELVTGRPTA